MRQRPISVVICTDGRLRSLQSTLTAVRALDYADFEVCVVCGPTTDGTREWLRRLTPTAKLADCPERNLSRARNIGIGIAAGEIVAFLDDDAIPEPEWLADLNAAYDDPEVAAAGGVVYALSGVDFQTRFVTVDRLGYASEFWPGPAPRVNFPFSPEFPHLLGANCSFRRDILVELGGFDEEYDYFLDETDLLARVNDAGGLIAQLPRAAVHHKFAASAQRDAVRIVRQWRSLIKNRVYFGLRNGAGHHTAFEILRAGLDDAERWRREVESHVAGGALPRADLARFEQEALSGFAAGLAAAQEPQRKLRRAAAPPPFQAFAAPSPPRLCLALVTQDYPPGHNGGVARNMAELAAAFARMGHHVHVLTQARGAPSLDFENGVWVHRLAVAPGPPPPDLIAPHVIPQSNWDHSRTMFDAVAKLDGRRRVDLVYAPLWDGEAAAFLSEPRLVVALQTTMDFWLDSNPERRADADWMAARGAPLLALERLVLTRAPRLHANSRAIVEDIGRRYRLNFDADRLINAPHGLSDWAGGAAPEADLRFLFVGRLETRKGVDVLLAAAPDVLRSFPDWRLDIVGDDTIGGGRFKTEFCNRADVADILSRVTFHGRVEEEALRAHYRDCAVLVAPSRYESFGLVYVEAMMFGKPVIGGRGGGGVEVIGEAGLCVDPGDVAGLAGAMRRLAADAAGRRAFGAAARRRYETHFTAEAAARALLSAPR